MLCHKVELPLVANKRIGTVTYLMLRLIKFLSMDGDKQIILLGFLVRCDPLLTYIDTMYHLPFFCTSLGHCLVYQSLPLFDLTVINLFLLNFVLLLFGKFSIQQDT